MFVNIEFLDTEPIENVITAMHFAVDKTIFIGFKEVITEYQKQTQQFLENYCGVKEVEFVEVPEADLKEIVIAISNAVKNEKANGNTVFFDLTGGEGLILVAFGMLAREYNLPIHQYDVEQDKLLELNLEDAKSISTYSEIKKKKVDLDLQKYIQMWGAVMKEKLPNEELGKDDPIFMKKVDAVWDVLCDYKNVWNTYSTLLGKVFKTDSLYADVVVDSNQIRNLEHFKKYLQALEAVGAIRKYRATKQQASSEAERERISFFYESKEMKQCLLKAGNLLELHTYQVMRKESDDCDQSVKIDWDGVDHGSYAGDVYNEIDVLCLKGNVLTFVSCKGGNMRDGQALEPMYELETVATRFGGKYAKKVLATLQPIESVYKERAKEMNIELRCYGK